jgi:glycosyltransferase involved in cell wall biosynthesis
MEKYCKEIVSELEKLCDLDLLALPGRFDGRPPSPWAFMRFVVHALWYLAVRGRHYDKILLGDLVLFPLAIWARSWALKAWVIQTVHGTDVAYGIRAGCKPSLYRVFLLVVRIFRGCVDAVVANSEATAAHCRRIGLMRVSVVQLGVRVPDSVPTEPVEDYILFVGRVARRKGVGWFAHNVLPLLPKHIRLKTVGTVWDHDERQVLDVSNRADLLGPVYGDELAQLRRRALAVIVPNVPCDGRDFEGFGLVAVEATAEGGLVLAADLDGISEAVRDGETGFLLPPQNARAWAAKIEEVAGWSLETRRAFINRAREMIKEHYNWRRVAQETLGIVDVRKKNDGAMLSPQRALPR